MDDELPTERIRKVAADSTKGQLQPTDQKLSHIHQMDKELQDSER